MASPELSAEPSSIKLINMLESTEAPLPESVGFSSSGLERLSEVLGGLVSNGNLPFVRMLVARKGRLVFDQAVTSSLARGVEMQSAVYRFYSLTKIVTAVAACKAMELGLLELDHPISRYIPSWKHVKVLLGRNQFGELELEKPDREPTIRDCLMHTAGISYGVMMAKYSGSGVDAADEMFDAQNMAYDDNIDALEKLMSEAGGLEGYVNMLAQIPLKFQPGTNYYYSAAPAVVGRVLEIVSGQKCMDFFREHLFKPLGIEKDMMTAVPLSNERLLPVYSGRGEFKEASGFDACHTCKKYLSNEDVYGDDSLCGTAEAFMKIMMMLGASGVASDGTIILQSLTVQSMCHTNHLPNERSLNDSWIKKGMPPLNGLVAPDEGSCGYGLGGMVLGPRFKHVTDSLCNSGGLYVWSGAASSHAFTDPVEEIDCVFCTSLVDHDPGSSFWSSSSLFNTLYSAIDRKSAGSPRKKQSPLKKFEQPANSSSWPPNRGLFFSTPEDQQQVPLRSTDSGAKSASG